ncbi:YgdI/YgdR family lipoprotein [Halobacterium litoreum]|uniref:YgdI/YgdR family lipoprotein n=1 Tax=Halobacterium litoreum TaxID=2039234 RepID=A0ABD5NFX8_9EURY|nr:YgdI/YgdR family lipoprotein [Halobacterium litoreum]UHH12884.1 YgdI/YgdR family lipoprotein [Halobacterium litoreum]
MTGRRLSAVLACALLVLAGCTAPTPAQTGGPDADPSASDGETATSDGPPEYVTVDGDLSVDANRTFERVESLVGETYPGTRVVVRDLTTYKSSNLGGIPFFRTLGVSNPALDTDQPAGLTTLDGTVYISPASAGPARTEQVLAHEFAHVAQVREEMVPWFGSLSLGRTSLDERFARRALVEGGAVYVTDAYTREHLPETQLQSAHIAARYANGTSGNRVVYSQYHFGVQYVNATIDDTADLASVYDDAPETTENLLHPETPRDDLAPLDVTTQTAAYERVQSPTGCAGELFVRIALRETAGKRAAVEAAEGWGNDRVLVFETGSTRSIAWVTRWDSTEDADEFAAASRTLADQNASTAYRTSRVSENTVVLFAGTESFVASAEASGNVTVSA